MKGGKYTKTLTKIWVEGVIRIQDIRGNVLPKFIHRIHKWRTRGKKLVPSHESEALEDKQKLQMKTFSELAECSARISPKIALYGRLFKYSDMGIKRDPYIFMETGSL